MSPEGNDSPTSMMRMRPSSSTHAMLRPTSPTPPRKTTRQMFASEETGVLQCGADPLAAPRPWPARAAGGAPPRGGRACSRAAFTGIGFEVMNSALNSGESCSWILRAAGHVAGARPGRASDGSAGRRGGSPRSRRRRRPGTRSRTRPSRRRSRPRIRSGPRRSSFETAWKSPVESFTATMFGRCARREQRVVLDARRGPAGDVVGDDRQLGGVGDTLEVRDQPALRRLVVVGGDDEQAVGAGVLGRLR